ncbi:MAG: helix-turn-helix transcriptional regulator [Candidatus Caccosoma sp.]|nr:helix-turn-helix transcriptional regulator [Candidatus Caccosoma sp.]
MNDIKQNIANNITELRKSRKWTQLDLANKLNYTDKAISKWERGESTPDVETLYKMAELFEVTVDYFFHEDSALNIEKYNMPKEIKNKKIAQLLLLITSIWFIAIVVFVYGNISNANGSSFWISFIWALPACGLITTLSFKRNNYVFGVPFASSFTIWTLLTAIYLQGIIANYNFWLIFLIGIPIQIVIIITYWLKK